MKLQYYILSIIIFILTACTRGGDEGKFRLQGAWELVSAKLFDEEVIYPVNGTTRLRIYDDSCYYHCQIASAPTGIMITPDKYEDYSFVEKGGGEVLYLQGGNTRPLTIVDDSTMIIQETGRVYTWRLCKDFELERSEDIINIIKADVDEGEAAPHHYVFSKAEKKLKSDNYTLTFIIVGIIIAFLVFISRFYLINKEKKRVEKELLRIEKERQELPEPVIQALNTVEEEFHQSDFYLSVRKRISKGEHLKRDDWNAIEAKLKSVYPGFSNKLMSLYSMSPVEYQVCLLLKLYATPSEIANVLCKDASSISTIRSRLYTKVFGKKGATKDWDEFIHSL